MLSPPRTPIPRVLVNTNSVTMVARGRYLSADGTYLADIATPDIAGWWPCSSLRSYINWRHTKLGKYHILVQLSCVYCCLSGFPGKRFWLRFRIWIYFTGAQLKLNAPNCFKQSIKVETAALIRWDTAEQEWDYHASPCLLRCVRCMCMLKTRYIAPIIETNLTDIDTKARCHNEGWSDLECEGEPTLSLKSHRCWC